MVGECRAARQGRLRQEAYEALLRDVMQNPTWLYRILKPSKGRMQCLVMKMGRRKGEVDEARTVRERASEILEAVSPNSTCISENRWLHS